MREQNQLDSHDMLGKIESLPRQLQSGFSLGEEAWSSLGALKPRALVVAGMGASAIGGDLLRLYLAKECEVPVFVFREYGLPRFIGADSLVVVSSYSGNTEEALACFGDAIDRKARVACISSGGELLREAARRALPFVTIPSGLPPRAGLGYSFAALLALAARTSLCADPGKQLLECVKSLEELNGVYSEPDCGTNPAALLAADLVERTPVIYCSTDLDAVGLRWKNQFCENSKKPAFVSFLPEANHNDMMGWEIGEMGLAAGVIVLRSPGEHPQVAQGLSLVKSIVTHRAHFCGEFWSSGSSLLSRMFSLILLGDYASVYLALARGVDPTPIGTIDKIKTRLRQGRADQ